MEESSTSLHKKQGGSVLRNVFHTLGGQYSGIRGSVLFGIGGSKLPEYAIERLNALMYGWIGYFQLGNIWGKLRELDAWIRNRLRYCVWKTWKKPDRRMRAFRQLGVEEGLAYAWSRSRMGGWAIAQSPIMGTTLTIERLEKRGYQSFTKYYEQLFHGS